VAVVVDASAMVAAVLGRSPGAVALRRRLTTETCHAPHLVDAEVGSVLRRHVLRGELAPADGARLLRAGSALVDHRHEMTGALAAAAWSLRDNVGFYDGLYVALATGLRASLLTADERLAAAPGLRCVVERVGISGGGATGRRGPGAPTPGRTG
jgi:predicted nucleic acid-binding protein